MATVPRLTSPNVAPTGIPDFRQTNPVNADLLNTGQRQIQQAGDALQNAGATFDVVQKQMVDRANALRVDDAFNQAQEQALRLQHDPKTGYTSLKGFDALSRPNGQPLASEYTGQLDKTISDIAGTLGNDRQREMFNKQVNNLRTQFLGNALQYEGQQAQVYDMSVREATVKNAGNALVLNFSDPTNVAEQTTRIRGAILGARDKNGTWIPGLAQQQGKSAAWGEEKASEAISGAHLGAIQSAMEAGNVNGAMAYRKKYASELTAGDMLKIDGTLQHNYDTMRGAAAGSQVFQSAQSVLAPTDFDRVLNVRTKLESGGRGDFNKDGTLLRGPVTRNGEQAMGSAQVMPSTARDPGYGIKPADLTGTPQQQAMEIKRVGDQKMAVLIKMFNGDLGKAFGAYNWGEGKVQSAERSAADNPGKTWLDFAPKETQTYVTSAMKMLNTPSESAPQRPTLEQLQQGAVQALGPAASPLAAKTARDTVTQQFEAQSKAIAQRKDEIVADTMRALALNGGRYSELPAAQRTQLTTLAPEKVDEVMSFGQKIAKGDNQTDPALYLKLSNDQGYLKNLSDAQYYQMRGRLSEQDFQHFANERATLSKPGGTNSPGNLDTGAVNRVVNARLQSLNIDPTPKDATPEAQRVGTIRRAIDASLIDAQRSAGKKFTDAETQQHIDGLFAKNVTFRSTFLGFETGGRSGQPLLSMKYGDIPSAQVDSIKKAFAARGNSNPTEGDILGAYFAGRAGVAPTRGAEGSF